MKIPASQSTLQAATACVGALLPWLAMVSRGPCGACTTTVSQWRIRKHHTVRDYWLIATRPEKYLDRIGRAGVFLYDRSLLVNTSPSFWAPIDYR